MKITCVSEYWTWRAHDKDECVHFLLISRLKKYIYISYRYRLFFNVFSAPDIGFAFAGFFFLVVFFLLHFKHHSKKLFRENSPAVKLDVNDFLALAPNNVNDRKSKLLPLRLAELFSPTKQRRNKTNAPSLVIQWISSPFNWTP